MHNARSCIAVALALALLATAPEAFAGGVAPAAATPVQREQAQSRFLRGKELYGQGKFDAALAEFTASLDIVASPNTRLYIGRCLREMNRLVAAYSELGRTSIEAKELAKDDPRYQKASEAAETERKALEPKLGFVEIAVKRAAPTTTMRVGGEEVRRGGWNEPVPVMPGTAEVVVETPGHAAVKKSVTISAGQKQSVELDAAADTPDVATVAVTTDKKDAAAPTDRTGLRTYAYVAGGVALAGLATFTVAGLLANGTYSDLEQTCGGERACPPGHEDEISSGKTQQTIANVGFVFFIVGAAAAVTLYVISTPKSATSTQSAQATAKLVTRGTFLGLEGSF